MPDWRQALQHHVPVSLHKIVIICSVSVMILLIFIVRQSYCSHCMVAEDCGIPFIHEVIMACPSCSAVAKQFRAWSEEVPGMAVVIAFTTSCSVVLLALQQKHPVQAVATVRMQSQWEAHHFWIACEQSPLNAAHCAGSDVQHPNTADTAP